MDRNNDVFNYILDNSHLGITLILKGRNVFKCEQCNQTRNTEQYVYQNAKYIMEHTPKRWEALCKKCVKRECGKRIFDKLTLGE